jgi:beta-aspartyl-peptidase (threonine type)
MPADWFHTERRRRQLEEFLARERVVRPPADGRMDTVGAVAQDRSGRRAAGPATGGPTGKRYGRVGDVPVIGAGTWADARCAVSATGDGEYFIRAGAARSVCHRMAAGETPGKAAGAVLSDISELGGLGGMIVLDSEGGFTLSFSTEGMYRGHVHAGGRRVAIFGE